MWHIMNVIYSVFLNSYICIFCLFVILQLKAFKALPKKQPLGSIYVKLLGQEIAFANVGKAVLEQATKVYCSNIISYELRVCSHLAGLN